jgi:hypothetical protein
MRKIMNKLIFLFIWILTASLLMAACATSPRAPVFDQLKGENCSLNTPPTASARGFYPPHAYPMRLYPVAPRYNYSGCQWVWISYAKKNALDYRAAVLFDKGRPTTYIVDAPWVHSGVTCHYDGEKISKTISLGSSGDLGCASEAKLLNLLNVKPKENDWWEFW